VTSFTTRPPYPRGSSPPYPLNMRLGGEPQNRSGRRTKEKNLAPTGTRTPTPLPQRYHDQRYLRVISTGGGGKKAIPVTGRGGPYGCKTSKLPHFLHNRLIDGGEVASLTCRPPFTHPPGRLLVLISVTGRVDPRATVRLDGLGQLKNPMTSSGMKPATFRLVA
jgi:hypothetical protein